MSKDHDLLREMTGPHREERKRLLAEAHAKYDRACAGQLETLRKKQALADKTYRERLSTARHAGQIRDIDDEHTEVRETAWREYLVATKDADAELKRVYEQTAIDLNRTIARVTQEWKALD